eukprot:CAMPEP_0172445352 /NCGR_PEP_ID=MMETSP1065-20121228/5180_1 /TAXON_ID=265537 /ORGANISM="Amphiprora paludosa, Strain CCMP125" /LENGTH=360 /DNA_ID=CAMNT_0013196155 /DNA_START=263 /DNA_END=1345 /DNA_ORIENTATION=-
MFRFFCDPAKSTSKDDDEETPEETPYVPPKVWTAPPGDNTSNAFGAVNQPTAGARFDKTLPRGKHPLQLYSLGTPNGQKVTIFLEELLAAGISHAEYDAWIIDIMSLDQFGSDFVAANPNSKIPALLDYSGSLTSKKNSKKHKHSPWSSSSPSTSKDKTSTKSTTEEKPLRVFESGSILLHLADTLDTGNLFLPPLGHDQRTEILNWLFWQMGSAPYLGGGFGHFFVYATVKQEYPIDRFTMETKRQLDVLNQQLAQYKFIAGNRYSIADMAIFPWYGQLVLGHLYSPHAQTFLNAVEEYPHVLRWAQEIMARPAVQRGLMVNKPWGNADQPQLKERHSAADIDQVLANMAQKKKETTSK